MEKGKRKMYESNNNSKFISPNQNSSTTIQTRTPFHYVAPNLYLTVKEINNYRDVDLYHLIKRRKLHLVLDLDNTLVAAQNLERPPTAEEKQAMKAMQDKHVIAGGAMYVKLRPGVREFLKKANINFDLTIFTMGCRYYAAEVMGVLQSEVPSMVVSDVIAREDCFQPKVKSLDVVLAHQHVVLIVDDKEKVWDEPSRSNLIEIGRYNGRPQEADDKELDRVFNILKAVHDVFYGHSGVSVTSPSLFNDDSQIDYYGKRDVRRVLPWVLCTLALLSHQPELFYLDYDTLE